MRKEAMDEGDQMMQFISYSNVDPNVVQAAKKSQGSNSPTNSYNPGSLIAPGSNLLAHGPGSGYLPYSGGNMAAPDKKDDDAMSDD
jgi:hypothetical protein